MSGSSKPEFLGFGSYGIIVSEPGSDLCRKIFTQDRASSLIREAFMIKRLSHIDGITEMIKLDQPTSTDHLIINQIRDNQSAWGVIVMKKYDLTLNQWLRTSPEYESRLQILKEIVRIVTAIHNAGVIHADLKLENIMLTKSGQVRIIDWGLSSFKDYARIHGTTKAYRPRKVSQDYCHDIYSLGVLMIQLVIGSLIINRLEYIACLRMLETAIADPPLRKLITRMIHPECEIRPSIQEIGLFFEITPAVSIGSHLPFPEVFYHFLTAHPHTQQTIIGVLEAIYRCLDSNQLRINYDHLMTFIDYL